jgi:hypothetical protein
LGGAPAPGIIFPVAQAIHGAGGSVSGAERRRLARIPLQCAVVVREKMATWTAETADVGARGCRITLKRPVAPGTLLQLRFDRGEGVEPLEAVGQVVWARKAAPLDAGVAFLATPREPSRPGNANWIDTMVVARLRQALRGGAAAGRLGTLENAVLRLGAPPRTPLDADARAVVRVAEREGPISAVGPEGLAALAALLEAGAVTLGRAGNDLEAWRRALAAPVAATGARGLHAPGPAEAVVLPAARAKASPPPVAVIVPLPPEVAAEAAGAAPARAPSVAAPPSEGVFALVPEPPEDAPARGPVLAEDAAPADDEVTPPPLPVIPCRISEVAAMIAESLMDAEGIGAGEGEIQRVA